MPAAHSARPARPRGGGRGRAAGRGARQRLRRRGREAQGKRLRGRPALDVVGQGETDARSGLRHRRLHAGQGLARIAGRDSRRLLGRWRRRAASSSTRRMSARASTSERSARSQGALEAAHAKHLSVRRDSRAQCADDVGRAQGRRRSELPQLDRRRSPARARIPSLARRPRSQERDPRETADGVIPGAIRRRPLRTVRSTTSSRSSQARRRR